VPGRLTFAPRMAATPSGGAALFALGLLSLGGGGCGDPCGDLQDICDQCVDPNQKAACEASVDEGAVDVCQQNIDSYGNVCLP